MASVRDRPKLLAFLPCLRNQWGLRTATELNLLAVERDAGLQSLLLHSPSARVLR